MVFLHSDVVLDVLKMAFVLMWLIFYFKIVFVRMWFLIFFK